MKPFKMAMINDLTGFGHCSLAVAIPIISVMGGAGMSRAHRYFFQSHGFSGMALYGFYP